MRLLNTDYRPAILRHKWVLGLLSVDLQSSCSPTIHLRVWGGGFCDGRDFSFIFLR